MLRRTLLVVVWLVGIVAATLVAANAVHTVSAPPDEESLAQHKLATAPGARSAPTGSRTYPTSGGTLAVRCSEGVITLVYATPEAGSTATATQTGPALVSVQFRGPQLETSFIGQCRGGVPDGQVDEIRHR